ncbi:MAG TPA: hypothetical protein PK622_13015 [Saprospiraceae bacterium]|nr:hypothetical protein [Saprospiraceae bacterium]
MKGIKQREFCSYFITYNKAFLLTHYPKNLFGVDELIVEMERENKNISNDEKYKYLSPTFLKKYNS